jgi:flagellar biosynthetic protein FlhB
VAEDKTEKATPKKREEARKKGQVARSHDVNGAVVMMASLLALSATGPKVLTNCQLAMLQMMQLAKDPDKIVNQQSIGTIMVLVAKSVGLSIAPILGVTMLAGVIASVAQVGIKPMPGGVKPDFKKLNPMGGFKNLFNPKHFGVEAAKNLAKVGLIGAIVYAGVKPKLTELAALVGTPPADLMPQIGHLVLGIAQRAAVGYLVLAAADYAWQRHKHEKSLKMDKQEIKEEFKQQSLPAEIKSAQRRRAMELSRARMMDAVPTADVIVTNPTHYAVALKYESGSAAPIVVAKGVDNLAFKIREAAKDAGVMIVPDPPLARTLYANVEIGRQIPEDLFHAVAQLLAYVYRVAGLRRAAA